MALDDALLLVASTCDKNMWRCIARRGMTQHGMAHRGRVRGIAWYGAAWHGMSSFPTACFRIPATGRPSQLSHTQPPSPMTTSSLPGSAFGRRPGGDAFPARTLLTNAAESRSFPRKPADMSDSSSTPRSLMISGLLLYDVLQNVDTDLNRESQSGQRPRVKSRGAASNNRVAASEPSDGTATEGGGPAQGRAGRLGRSGRSQCGPIPEIRVTKRGGREQQPDRSQRRGR